MAYEEPNPAFRPIPPGYTAVGTPVTLNLFDAIENLMDNRRETNDWQDALAAVAEAVWERLPEADQTIRDAFDEYPDNLAEVIHLALRVAVTLGVGLVRTYPPRPEDLGDWPIAAARYAGLSPCEVAIVPDRDVRGTRESAHDA
jgi:hypothetical protein